MALREGMSYVLGMNEVCTKPDIIKELFGLVDSSEEGNIAEFALRSMYQSSE